MKILITGSTGFIGSHLVRRLVGRRHRVHAIVRRGSDTRSLRRQGVKTYPFADDVEALTAYMKKQRFDGVVHLASLFLAQHKSQDVKPLIASNVYFGTAVLEATVKSKTPWFISTGTFWQHYRNRRFSPANLYAATKQAFEDIARYYIETSKVNFVTLKLSDTFGPHDPRPKLFNLWFKIAASGESLDMSPGYQRLDISYVENVIDGYERMMKLLAKDRARALNGKTFAIRSGQVMSLRALARLFERVTKKKLFINWGARPYRPREVMVPWNKGKTIPGWKPRITLREGIRRLAHE